MLRISSSLRTRVATVTVLLRSRHPTPTVVDEEASAQWFPILYSRQEARKRFLGNRQLYSRHNGNSNNSHIRSSRLSRTQITASSHRGRVQHQDQFQHRILRAASWEPCSHHRRHCHQLPCKPITRIMTIHTQYLTPRQPFHSQQRARPRSQLVPASQPHHWQQIRQGATPTRPTANRSPSHSFNHIHHIITISSSSSIGVLPLSNPTQCIKHLSTRLLPPCSTCPCPPRNPSRRRRPHSHRRRSSSNNNNRICLQHHPHLTPNNSPPPPPLQPVKTRTWP